MGKWEHRTVGIRYRRKKHKNWVVEYAEEPPLVGLQAILEAYESDGWELISLVPEQYEAFPAFAKWHVDPVVYRAAFKRPAED